MVRVHLVKEIDVPFVVWRVMGVFGAKPTENIANMKSGVMAREDVIVRKELQSSTSVLQDPLLISFDVRWRRAGHGGDPNSGNQVHKILQEQATATFRGPKKPDQRYGEVNAADDPPVVGAKFPPAGCPPVLGCGRYPGR